MCERSVFVGASRPLAAWCETEAPASTQGRESGRGGCGHPVRNGARAFSSSLCTGVARLFPEQSTGRSLPSPSPSAPRFLAPTGTRGLRSFLQKSHGLGSSSRPVSSGPRDLLLPAGHLPRPFPGHAMSPRKAYPRGRTLAPRRPSGSGLLLPHGTWRSQREGSCGHPTAPTRQLTWANGSRFVQNVYINSTLLAYRLDKSLPTLTSEKQPEVEEAINHACFFFLQINGKLTQVGLENHLFGHGLRLLQPRV